MQLLRNTPEFKPSEVTVAEEVIESYLDNPEGSGYYIFVAVIASSIAGYLCYGPTPLTENTWDIYWIAVSAEKRGSGIGSALIKAAEKEIRHAKGRLVIIETSSTPAYEETIRFYLGCGYEMIARIPDFYSAGDDKLVLQKRLSY
ncbi:MAG: GNAT family N-acetyltransferase [Dehalococcoidales bacterium]|nr:GNAT family N-acetyltransferase [Dehalococcoidales bacterium]